MTLCKEVYMRKLLGVFLMGMFSLLAVEIPLDQQIKTFELKKGILVWLRGVASSEVACRFVGQDPLQGKPQIFDLDCPSAIFEQELPAFLNYCEEEIQKKGGASLGIVAVGSMDPQGLHHYLAQRYDQSTIGNKISAEAIQLTPVEGSKEIDVLLSYPTALLPAQTDKDIKKLWAFYLIQSMAENRFKKATIDVDGNWISPEETKYLLPAQTTVGHGVERTEITSETQGRLLKTLLTAIQDLKKRGFNESELADSKSQLIKHLKRFYEANPNEKTLADYYASHLAASLPCPDYLTFMVLSFQTIPEISMADIAEMLKVSFKDDTRQVMIQYPEERPLQLADIQTTLNQFVSDNLEFKPDEIDPIVLVEGKDPFSQLLITDEELKMIRGIIQTVAETNPIKLGFIRSDLEKKRLQLLHIHPLRSLAAMFTDPYTKQCVGEIMDSYFKWRSFISDFSKRINQESERGNLMMYVQGFCLTVKANPEQVRMYLTNKEWEKLVKYLIKLSN
jgi:hypothetical protein